METIYECEVCKCEYHQKADVLEMSSEEVKGKPILSKMIVTVYAHITDPTQKFVCRICCKMVKDYFTFMTQFPLQKLHEDIDLILKCIDNEGGQYDAIINYVNEEVSNQIKQIESANRHVGLNDRSRLVWVAVGSACLNY